MKKHLRELKRDYPGARIERTGKHFRLVLRDGRTSIVPGSPSCWRALRNLKADLRRKQKELNQ